MHFKSFDKIESDLEYDIDISNPITRKALLYLFLVYMNIHFIAKTKHMRKLQFHLYAASV